MKLIKCMTYDTNTAWSESVIDIDEIYFIRKIDNNYSEIKLKRMKNKLKINFSFDVIYNMMDIKCSGGGVTQ